MDHEHDIPRAADRGSPLAPSADGVADGLRAPDAALQCHDQPHCLDLEDSYRITVVFPVAGTAGSARFTVGDWQVDAGPGYVSVLPPGIHGMWRAQGAMEYLHICFPIVFAGSWIPSEPFCRADDKTLVSIGQVIAAALRECEQTEPWDLSAWSTLVGGHLARCYGGRDAARDSRTAGPCAVTQAMAYIDRNLQQRLRVADLAAWAGMSRSRFAAAFKRLSGVSPHRFIVSRRVEKAQRMLIAEGSGLADIALAAGFCSQSHMTRVFRERLGVTPKEYRDRSRTAGQFASSVREDGVGAASDQV